MFEKFRNLPREIEAVQFTDRNKNQVFHSLAGCIAPDFEDGNPILKVETIHGDTAIVRIGDWIAKEHVLGFYCPIKDDVFQKSYVKSE